MGSESQTGMSDFHLHFSPKDLRAEKDRQVQAVMQAALPLGPILQILSCGVSVVGK